MGAQKANKSKEALSKKQQEQSSQKQNQQPQKSQNPTKQEKSQEKQQKSNNKQEKSQDKQQKSQVKQEKSQEKQQKSQVKQEKSQQSKKQQQPELIPSPVQSQPQPQGKNVNNIGNNNTINNNQQQVIYEGYKKYNEKGRIFNKRKRCSFSGFVVLFISVVIFPLLLYGYIIMINNDEILNQSTLFIITKVVYDSTIYILLAGICFVILSNIIRMLVATSTYYEISLWITREVSYIYQDSEDSRERF